MITEKAVPRLLGTTQHLDDRLRGVECGLRFLGFHGGLLVGREVGAMEKRWMTLP
jgi:hypothetical protein